MAALERLPPAELPEPQPLPEGQELVPVEITWDNVGPLYKGFFSDREAMTALSETLAPWFNDTVQMHVRWDQENFLGTISIRVPPKALRQPLSVDGGVVDLQLLAPLTAALATYRDSLSAQFDVRIQSFRIYVDFFRKSVHCRVGPEGKPPPDGTRVSPCIELNGQEACGLPEASGVRFDAEAAGKLQTCFAR